MILYNVTISIDANISEEWLEWMRSQHIPEVMATGCFIESRISRVHGEEEGGETFAITYLSPSQEKMTEYEEKHSDELKGAHSKQYGGRFTAFRTKLTVIEEYK